MAKLHIISDLDLGFNENSASEEELPEGTDLVIFNGNISVYIKRAFLYMETLARKYPEVQFIVNLGQKEIYSSIEKYVNEFVLNVRARSLSNSSWPINLHFDTEPMIVQLRTGMQVTVLTTYGFPYIHRYNCEWENTVFSKYVHVDILNEYKDQINYIPQETSRVRHGHIPRFATMEDVNRLHMAELKKVRDWETTTYLPRILVTHICPYEDPRLIDMITTAYNIHLAHGSWIGSGTNIDNINFLGARLYANAGRGKVARSRLFDI